jgi:membrane protein YdbS with pleckstrin-like domain
MIEELAVPYDPSRAEEKVRRRRRMMWSRVVSLGITVAVVIGLYLWQRSRSPGAGLIGVSVAIVAASVAWLVAYLIAYRRARKERDEVGTGFALRIGRPGVQVAGLFAPWPDVAALATTRGGLGRSARLQLTTEGGAVASVPLDQVDVRPATLDSTARAYSAGRHGVDLNALDN